MRLESDSIGTLQLASDCLYGARTARCEENTTFSGSLLSSYPELIRALALVKKACAQANDEAGHLPADVASLIATQCDRLLAGEFREQFPVDMLHGGGYIGFNININEVIANLANLSVGKSLGSYEPVDPKKHVNCSQSTADVCHTAVRLALIERYARLNKILRQMESTFDQLHTRFKDVTTIARTCLQDAMPVALGELFGAYAAFIKRRHKECHKAVYELLSINLGGTVIGSGDGASSEYRAIVVEKLARLCDQPLKLRDNLFDAAQNIDDLINVSAQLRITADGLIKIAKDIRILGSGPQCGFGELALPVVQEGSSFFAGKVNPIVAETLIQACIQVIACDRAASAAMEHAELNLNVFESVATKNILDAMEILANSCHLFDTKCLQGMEANNNNCQQYASIAERNFKKV